MFDIQLQNHGSIVILSGVTPEGRDWLEANLDADAQRWCGGFAVEPRYVENICEGALDDGLEIA